MKTKSLLAILIVYFWILTACQSASSPPTATIVPPTDTPIPTNTLKPMSTTIPSTPTLLPSTLTTVDPENFIAYDSTDFIKENDLADRIPVFSVKYPPEWEYKWFSDSGAIVLLISSVDVNDVWSLQDTSGATMMVIPEPYDGKSLTDMFIIESDRRDRTVEEPITLTINGQDAARVVYMNNGQFLIDVVIVREEFALHAVAFFLPEKEAEFRPLLETMINTIQIR
jgi:hypothetical protein